MRIWSTRYWKSFVLFCKIWQLKKGRFWEMVVEDEMVRLTRRLLWRSMYLPTRLHSWFELRILFLFDRFLYWLWIDHFILLCTLCRRKRDGFVSFSTVLVLIETHTSSSGFEHSSTSPFSLIIIIMSPYTFVWLLTNRPISSDDQHYATSASMVD